MPKGPRGEKPVFPPGFFALMTAIFVGLMALVFASDSRGWSIPLWLLSGLFLIRAWVAFASRKKPNA